MTNLGKPFTKTEIIAAFKAEWPVVHQYFSDFSQDQFFSSPDDVWTPADNLVHLIKSVSPVITALGTPKAALKLRFGKAKHASRSLAEVRAMYMEFANAGLAIAPGSYIPQIKEVSETERANILAKWLEKGEKLMVGVEKWADKDFDEVQLPHPLLGNLTLREILCFTLYHNMHHVNDVQRMINQPEVEWFEEG